MYHFILLPLAVVQLAAAAEKPATTPLQIHVAPDGNDTGPGSAARPFGTPGRALAELEKHHTSKRATDITVILHEGVYSISVPLIIGPQHLPAGGHRLTFTAAEGAKPIISGGRRIGGWQTAADGTFAKTIADVAAGKWTFRELFVNNTRRPRAASSESGLPAHR